MKPCKLPNDHVFGLEDGLMACLICGAPIQDDCDLPYDPELEAKIDDALGDGLP
jgi:hypothetical protein